MVVKSYFALDGLFLGDPVKESFRLFGTLFQKLCSHLRDLVIFISENLEDLDRRCVFKANNLSRSDAVEVLVVFKADVIAVDEEVSRKRDFVITLGGFPWEERRLKLLGFLRVDILKHERDWVKNGERAVRDDIKVFSDPVFEDVEIDEVLITPARDGDGSAEVIDALRCEPSAAHAVDSEQARVVPAADVALENELLELALRQHHVRDVEARVLPH